MLNVIFDEMILLVGLGIGLDNKMNNVQMILSIFLDTLR